MNTYAAEQFSFSKIDNHFKWGEYDSIIQILEPLVKNHALTVADKENSFYFKILGVAYSAKGRISEARIIFSNALVLDSSVTIDSQYISKTIQDVFYSAKEEYKKNLIEKMRQDSLLKQKDIAIMTSKLNLKKEKQTISQTYFLAASGVCVLTGIVTGIEGFFEYKKSKESFTEFTNAASNGNLQEYNSLKTQVNDEDTYTTIYIAASALSIIGGSLLFYKYEKTFLNQKKISLQITGFPEITFVYEF